ncbi:MAG: radical SAM protein, partial [Myxococcales bacterium]|nr:radical SAM protein [Myxococcales bacterium]
MNAPTALEEELRSRLALVRSVVQRSAEPLHRPLGFDFRPTPGMTHLQAWQEHDARVRLGQSFAPATVYVNIPFCARVCTYCLLSSARVPARDVVERYVDALVQEIELFEPNVRSLRFGSLHVGGGTPTLLNEAQLDRLFTALTRLPFAEHARFGVEAHPSTSSRERLEVLARHGVHRLSFGVESWTPEVLRNVNRQDQTAARVRDAVRTARELGFSINIDLLAGLPGETLESWERSVRQTLELEPDSCSVNRFFAENSSLASHGYGPNEADRSLANAMLLEADALIRSLAPPRWPREPLRQGGFGTQYVWDRSSAARRYFQSDMVGPVSTLTFGVGALGHLYGRYHSIPAGGVPEYLASLEAAEPPEMLTSPL